MEEDKQEIKDKQPKDTRAMREKDGTHFKCFNNKLTFKNKSYLLTCRREALTDVLMYGFDR
jgi:hypothetical protein